MEQHLPTGPAAPAGAPLKKAKRWQARLLRLLLLVAGSLLIARLLDFSAQQAARQETPAGFGQGLLHGACMPATWPALALGHDPAIIAARHDGRPYKLGYTLGVNLCGAFFFGVLFWRLKRWRHQFGASASENVVK